MKRFHQETSYFYGLLEFRLLQSNKFKKVVWLYGGSQHENGSNGVRKPFSCWLAINQIPGYLNDRANADISDKRFVADSLIFQINISSDC